MSRSPILVLFGLGLPGLVSCWGGSDFRLDPQGDPMVLPAVAAGGAGASLYETREHTPAALAPAAYAGPFRGVRPRVVLTAGARPVAAQRVGRAVVFVDRGGVRSVVSQHSAVFEGKNRHCRPGLEMPFSFKAQTDGEIVPHTVRVARCRASRRSKCNPEPIVETPASFRVSCSLANHGFCLFALKDTAGWCEGEVAWAEESQQEWEETNLAVANLELRRGRDEAVQLPPDTRSVRVEIERLGGRKVVLTDQEPRGAQVSLLVSQDKRSLVIRPE